MSQLPDALWLTVSRPLQTFDRPLLKYLSQHLTVGHWEYQQTPDESNSLEVALVLLHDYLKHHERPIHLIGHSTGGLMGLLYARRYPQRVKSLTLLSVGVDPAMSWQSQYYAQRRRLRCDQQTVLRQIAHSLLGCTSKDTTAAMIKRLKEDLYQSLSPHSLLRSISLPPMPVDLPLLVCGSVDDTIIATQQFREWLPYLHRSVSRLWLCPGGRHFFHYFYAQLVGEQMVRFWQDLPSISSVADSYPSMPIEIRVQLPTY
jgi:pimeloyl-ACP methyl ester carboxylesterase